MENLVSRVKWQEEDADDGDVKDNWEDEDEEPPKPEPKPAPAKAKSKDKRPTKPSTVNNEPLTPQELREKKLAEERAQKESDMKLTRQMFDLEDKDIPLEFPLETQEDFNNFHKNIVRKLWCYDKSPHYYNLLEKMIRDLCAPLEVDELKNLSSTVNALFNEKVKAGKTKPKKKTKGLAIKVDRADDFMDELDDIM